MPASPAICHAAITCPPRPLIMSPTTLPGAVPTYAPPNPNSAIEMK